MSQDSVIIYRDIRDAVMNLPPELYKEVMRLIFAYAFDDEEPGDDADPIAKGFYLAFKSRFDMNAARYERAKANGSKGGAPVGNQNARKKAAATGSETTQNNPKQPKTTKAAEETTEDNQTPEENNPKQTISISKSILSSTNVEDKEKIEKEKTTEKKKKEKIAFASSVMLTEDEYNAFVEQFGEAATKELIQILNDYKEANGKRYKSDAAAIRSWVVDRYLQKQKPTATSYGQTATAAPRPTTGTRPIPSTVEGTPQQPPRRFKGTL